MGCVEFKKGESSEDGEAEQKAEVRSNAQNLARHLDGRTAAYLDE
jgi:hypothetical protein